MFTLCEQKCPPNYFPNPYGYQDSTVSVKFLRGKKVGNFRKFLSVVHVIWNTI